jgi:hypothetical protein
VKTILSTVISLVFRREDKNTMKGPKTLVPVVVALVGLTFVPAAVGLLPQPIPQTAADETISGTISSTRIITQNARLTGNVTCTVDSAPCIQFGAPSITLDLNGFAISGLADASTSCQGGRVGNATGTFNEDGIAAINQADVTIQGPGLIQRFRGDGVFLYRSLRSLVAQVTTSTNCQSGILLSDASDSHIEANISVRNGDSVFPCGGI